MTVFHKDGKILREMVTHDMHFHGNERWLGKSTDQTGDNWSADNLIPHQVVTGPSCTYSTAATSVAKVIGAADTPRQTGKQLYDLHNVLVVAVSTNKEFRFRCVHGSSTGTLAEGLAAGRYTENMMKYDALNPQQSAGIPVSHRMPKLDSGNRVWFQAKSVGTSETIDFFVGLHEYD